MEQPFMWLLPLNSDLTPTELVSLIECLGNPGSAVHLEKSDIQSTREITLQPMRLDETLSESEDIYE
jgi:hypothetical protein